jgi:hypothetical protein
MVTGCADLGPIRSWADTSLEAAQYSAILETYESSPDRQGRYQDDSASATLDALKTKRAEQVERMTALHIGIAEYMRVLGQLAGDETASYDESFDGLADDLEEQEWLAQREIDAYVALGRVLSNAAADRWRRGQLEELIGEANAPLQIVISTLETALASEILDAVDDEALVISNHFAKILRRVKAAGGASEQLATTISAGSMEPALRREVVETLGRSADANAGLVMLIAGARADHLAHIDRQREAVLEYRVVLQRIAEGHQSLYDSRTDLTDSNLLEKITQRNIDLRKAFAGVRNLQ